MITIFDVVPLDSQNVSNLKFKYPAFGIRYGDITFIVRTEFAFVFLGNTDISIATYFYQCLLKLPATITKVAFPVIDGNANKVPPES